MFDTHPRVRMFLPTSVPSEKQALVEGARFEDDEEALVNWEPGRDGAAAVVGNVQRKALLTIGSLLAAALLTLAILQQWKHAAATTQKAALSRALEGQTLSPFLDFDGDKDQLLNWNEFFAATQSFHPPLSRSDADFAFQSFDINHDGQVSVVEYLDGGISKRSMVSSMTFGQFRDAVLSHAPGLKDAFDKIDHNRDGASNRDEFIIGAQSLGLTVDEAAFAFGALDKDNNGKIGPPEFFSAIDGKAPRDAPLEGLPGFVAPARAELDDFQGKTTPITVDDFKKRMGETMFSDAYLKLDIDNDGFLSKQDFTSVASKSVFKPSLTDSEADYIFRGFDANRDNAVCIAEFFGGLRLGRFFQTTKELQSVGAYVKTKPAGAPRPLPGLAGATAAAAEAATATTAAAASAQPPAKPLSAPAVRTPAESQEARPSGMSVATYASRMGSRPAEDVFTAIDTNGDAKWTWEEYRNAVSQQFHPPLESTEVEYTFHGLDSNRDGFVTPTEYFGTLQEGKFFSPPEELWKSAPSPSTPSTPSAPAPAPSPAAPAPQSTPSPASSLTEEEYVEHLQSSFVSPQQAFTSMDSDTDRFLNFEEFAEGAKNFKKTLDDSQAMYAFQGFDADKDHKISWKEFSGDLQIGHFFQSEEALDAASRAAGRLSESSNLPAIDDDRDFDCDAGFKDWQFDWSEQKQRWCCSHKNRGCPASPDAVAFPSPAPSQPAAAPSAPRMPTPPPPPPTPAPTPTLAPTTTPRSTTAAPTTRAPTTTKAPTTTRKATEMTIHEFVERMPNPSSMKDSFNALDKNRDLYISIDEMMASRDSFKPPFDESDAVGAVTGFDKNDDDLVSWEEFVIGMRKEDAMIAAAQGIGLGTQPSPSPPTSAAANSDSEKHSGEKESVKASGRISVDEFTEQMRSSNPSPQAAFKWMDQNKDGHLDHSEFLLGTSAFAQGLSDEQGDFAFEGIDLNGDKIINLDELMAVLQVGSFYPSKALLEAAGVLGSHSAAAVAAELNSPKTSHLRGSSKQAGSEILGTPPTPAPAPAQPPAPPAPAAPAAPSAPAAPPTPAQPAPPAPAPAPSPADSPAAPSVTYAPATRAFKMAGPPVPATDLQSYLKMPAVVSGKASLSLLLHQDADSGTAALPEQDLQKMQDSFRDALETELGLSVSITSTSTKPLVEGVGANQKAMSFDMEFDADNSDNGGQLQFKLQQNAAAIEKRLEEAIQLNQGFSWLSGAAVWLSISFGYYGNEALMLPQGQMLTQLIGRRPGEQCENGSPPFAVFLSSEESMRLQSLS